MLRLVVDESGQIWPDAGHKAPGRGTYLCMQEDCMSAMSDRRLQPMKAKFPIVLPQWEVLRQRIVDVLDACLVQGFSRLRARADIGRDAVMHRLWNNAPMILFGAADAGDAIRRQIEMAVAKRMQSGYAVELVEVESTAWLGRVFGRECVAVASVDCSPMAEKLKQYCVWFRHVKVSG